MNKKQEGQIELPDGAVVNGMKFETQPTKTIKPGEQSNTCAMSDVFRLSPAPKATVGSDKLTF